MKKNNKGSTLTLAVILFSVLLTIGAASLMILNTNYKVRVKEGKRLQNLYESEAGLDIVYNILIKNFEAGINYGSKLVDNIPKEEFDNIDNLKDKDEKINEVFKQGFIDIVNELSIKETVENRKYIENYDVNDKYEYKEISFKGTDSEKPHVSCLLVETKYKKNKLERYEVKIQSEFSSNESDSSTGKNTRKVQITYDIKVPDYEDLIVIKGENNKVEYPSEFKNKIIAVDGNMNIENKIPIHLIVKGDIFVKGTQDDNNTYGLVYDKYKGGISIDTKSSFAIDMIGNIITANTLNIVKTANGNQGVKIQGNVYAGNIFIGNKNGSTANDSFTEIKGQAIVDNDLTMKGKNTRLTINEFYGINDKTYTSEYSDNGNYKTKSRNSSSIIVNGKSENSEINIVNKAYIMGTAYINAQNGKGDSYKTGESVAVQGNYIAYTKSIDKFKDYNFDKYGSLYLVDNNNENGVQEKLTVEEKSQYFKTFFEENQGDIKDGGVKLPKHNTYSIGAIVYKEGNNIVVEKSNYSELMNNIIDEKRKEYAKEVYCMGKESNLDLIDVYNELGSIQSTVKKSVNFDAMKFTNGTYIDNYDNNYIVLNNNENKPVVLTDNKNYDSDNEVVVNMDNGYETNMLIITNSDVKINISSLKKYNGAIISSKNIEFSGNNTSQISMDYNEKVVNDIISKYSDKLNGVFNNTQQQKPYIVKNNVTPIYSYNYDIKRYVTSRNWNIIK